MISINSKKQRDLDEPEEEKDIAEKFECKKEIKTGDDGGNADEPEEYQFLIPLNSMNRMKGFVDRYFLRYYKYIVAPGTEENLSQYAFLHTNKLFMIGITCDHYLVQNKAKIKEIRFDCVYKGDLKEMVQGKRKKGGVKISEKVTFAEIVTEDGVVCKLNGIVDGHIIEYNENLIANPSLLINDPEGKGYVAILNSGLTNYSKNIKKLQTQEEYEECKIKRDTLKLLIKEEKMEIEKVEGVEAN